MPVFTQDITIDQGADFTLTTQPWVPACSGPIQDITGCTCRLNIFKNSYDVTPMLSLTGSVTANGFVVSNGVLGTVTFTITNAATAKLLNTIGPLSYDLFVDRTGAVTAVTVTNGGSGYTSAPTVAITGGSGSLATATATIASSAVTAVTITDAGYGYLTAPTVGFSGGGGTSAAATATISTLPITTLLQTGTVYLTATN